jgi:hypothetical protein
MKNAIEILKAIFGFVKTACMWVCNKILLALDWSAEKYITVRSKNKQEEKL